MLSTKLESDCKQRGNTHPYIIEYSDYDVFLENDEGSRVYRRKKLFQDTFVKHVFQNFEPFLANRALKFQKSANVT